jgi:hypothetical protein
MNADGTFSKSGRAFNSLDFGDTGVDEGLVGEVDTPELKTVAFRSGF